MTSAGRTPTLALVALACCAAGAGAAEQRLVLDPAATRVSFHLDATLHAAEGTLALVRGEIRFDLSTGSAGGEVVLDATSADTGNDKRDEKLHREVLESDAYPEIVFRPRAVSAAQRGPDSGTVTLTGTVSIHGGDHEASVTATVERSGANVRATGTLNVPYVAWGLHDPSVFVLRVAKVVEVSIAAAGTLEDAPPPTPPPGAGR